MAEPPRIVVVSTMRDEGPNLLHWIAHCRALGVADFLVASNACTDGTDAMLDLLADAGLLTHLEGPVPSGKTPQWAALRRARDHPAFAAADWVAVLDCDEYPNLRGPHDTLADLIAETDADAIVLPWRLFGCSGHAKRPDAPPTRAFARAISPGALYPPQARFFKTLYRRRGPFARPGVHRPKQTGPARWIDGSGDPLAPAIADDDRRILLWGAPLATGRVQLNHYSTRSAEEFLSKTARGLPNHTDKRVDLAYWVERNFNTVPDDSILRHETRALIELAALRTIPGLADTERASIAHHEDAFRAALSRPDGLALYSRLLLAGSSVELPDATARRLVSLYGAAARDEGKGDLRRA